MSVRALALQWLGRTTLLLLWSLVVWGGLLLATALVDVASEGVRPALARLVPPQGASLWAWLNALSVGLAVAVGLLALGLAVSSRRGGRASSAKPPAS
jgi:hypothetical protein